MAVDLLDDISPVRTPEPPPVAKTTYGDPVTPSLLDRDDPTIIQTLLRWFEEGRQRKARRIAEHEVNLRRRYLHQANIYATQKRENLNQWVIWEPPGGAGMTPSTLFNMPDRLISRLTSHLYADFPQAEAEAASGDEADKDAAEFATKALMVIQSETGTNEEERFKACFDQYASLGGSGYIHYFVNPTGGGRQPVELEASPEALTADDPLVDGSGLPYDGDLTTRYAAEDGTLVDDVGQSALRWVPRLEAECLHAHQVFFAPWTASSLWDAEGALIVAYRPWRTLLQWFPDLMSLGEEEMHRIASYEAKQAEYLLPRKAGSRKADRQAPKDAVDRLVWTMIFYAPECPLYPDGAYIVTLGDTQVAKKEPWILITPRRESLDIPLTQIRHLRGVPGDADGIGLMDIFGSAHEGRQYMMRQVEDMVDRQLNAKAFAPVHSIAQVREGMLGFNSVVPVNPGGVPEFERPPDPPQAAWEMYDRNTRELQDASGLQQTGQGLEASGVNSGRQAIAIVGQVHAGLADMSQSAKNLPYIRTCRVQLQLLKKGYTTPMRLRFLGEDGAYKEQAWMGSDLGSTRDVRIKPGTGTMLPPIQKLELATAFVAQGVLTQEDVRDVLGRSVSLMTGVQDSPHTVRVRRQITVWKAGPPQGWAPAPPPLDPMAPPQPDPMSPFDERMVDVTPMVAQLRLVELLKAMSTETYGGKPPEWRMLLDTEVQRMQQAMMPPQPPPGAPGPVDAESFTEEPAPAL